MKNMEQRLTPEDKSFLEDIYAPIPVAIQPEDTWQGLCVTESGQIRHYGSMHKPSVDQQGERCYLASEDCGLSWKLHRKGSDREIETAVQDPRRGTWISIVGPNHFPQPPQKDFRTLYCLVSAHGPGDTEYDAFPMKSPCSWPVVNQRTPLFLRNRDRVLLPAQCDDNTGGFPVVYRSDDGGRSWECAMLDPVPPHEAIPPHCHVRWQNTGVEATIAEQKDGSLLLLARTSQDFHYMSRSFDGGETWTKLTPSPFHGTLTMPTLFPLSDGRLLLFWCNTSPLPEEDITDRLEKGELGAAEQTGKSEDVFTNRDVCHAAISEDDGKTWIGFREIYLSHLRNDEDYRAVGGAFSSRDKSVHQFQALELPLGKVLLALGQHQSSRIMVIFDPEWLYETDRKEEFQAGLTGISTHTYYKSVSGGYRAPSAGHCSWNRRSGAVLLPDPLAFRQEALFFCRIPDPRLVSDTQGAVWNFPLSRKGKVTVRLFIPGKGLRLSLSDHWFNPIDEYAALHAPVTLPLEPETLPGVRDGYGDLTMEFDTDARAVQVLWNGKFHSQTEITDLPPFGLCYLHLQTLPGTDKQGTYVKYLKKEALS